MRPAQSSPARGPLRSVENRGVPAAHVPLTRTSRPPPLKVTSTSAGPREPTSTPYPSSGLADCSDTLRPEHRTVTDPAEPSQVRCCDGTWAAAGDFDAGQVR